MKLARSLPCLSVAALVLRFAAGCSGPGAVALPDDGGADAADATSDATEPGDTSMPEDQSVGDASEAGDAGSDHAVGTDAASDGAMLDSETADSATGTMTEAGPEGSTSNEASTSADSSMASEASDDATAESGSTDAGAEAESGGATQHVLLLAVTGAGAVTGDVFDGAASTWAAASTVPGTATNDDLSLAMLPATGQGIGLLHGASGAVLTTAWNGASWSSLAQLNADTTQGRPAIVAAATGSSASAVFWGTDYKYYFESYAAGAWSASPQAVIPAGAAQPCGPTPGVLAPLGTGASLVFVNGTCSGTVNHLYDSDLASGSWQASTDVASNPSYGATQRPAVVAPTSGPELVVVYIQQGTSQLWSASRTSGSWSTPAAIASAFSADPVALAPLSGGGVLLAFRGTDANLYTATYSAGSWSSPAAAFSASVSVVSTPALATGIGAAAAEMAYVDGTGALQHTRLTGGAWAAPVAVAAGVTGFAHVAIASGP